MSKTTEPEEGFAATMQQFSAEAEKAVPPMPVVGGHSFLPSAPVSSREAGSIAERIQGLENTLLSRLEKLAAEMKTARTAAFEEQFRKIDEQLALIRNSEGINQKLFDSLHAELIKYRDNFVHESLQKPFIHDLVCLYDHLSGLWDQVSIAAQEKGTRSTISQWCDNLENAIHSLVEILHRFEVKEIEPRDRVDLAYHRVLSFEPTAVPEEDGNIVMRVKRGFVWRGKLIRPEEVIAKRFG